MARAAQVGDELGSALIAARLIHDVIRVAFCLEKEYAPYAKWLGSALSELPCAPQLVPNLQAARDARGWRDRQTALNATYETLLAIQRSKGWRDQHSGHVQRFWSRPLTVIGGVEVARAVFSHIEDERLRQLADTRPIGNIDLISDSAEVLQRPELRVQLRQLFA